MLTKQAIVTVIPAVVGQAYSPASTVCTPNSPSGGTIVPGGTPPGTSGAAGGIAPAAGTPILLETSNGAGGYNTAGSTAPAPAGYVCRYETVFVSTPGVVGLSVQYNVVCTL